ncbi:MAG: HlyD family efflux transporter periplasmic adaptor subunit [Clostridiaceae bacterium]|mgnify:CR=1 FL=1|nr:HlyD family efflux transporter periplasmic adaptor subunit [Clostridiaceae bacterium]
MSKKIIIGIAGVILLSVIIVANMAQGSVPSFSGGKTFDVKVKTIEKGKISSVVSASGVVEATEKVDIYYDDPVKVKQIYVSKNQKVTKGQKLVELDMDSFNSEIEQMRINMQIQELTISKLRNTDATRSVGTLKSAVDLADKAVENAKRQLDEAINNYNSSKQLLEANAISRSEFERTESLKHEAELGYNNAQQNRKNAEESLLEAQKSNSQSQNSKNLELQISEKNLQAVKLKIAELEKKIKTTNENMLSPIDGVITEINLEKGGYTNTSLPGFSILAPEKLKIRSDVKEFYVKDITEGQSVEISGDAIGEGESVKGVIESISAVAKKKIVAAGEETLVEVVIAILDGSSALKPGLTVNSKITTKTREDAVIVSFDMLTEDEKGNKLVFIVDKNNKMIKRPIKLGITSELDAEVVEGLNAGDSVVLYPKPSYTDGATARITKGK